MEKSLDIEFQFIKDILQIRSQNMRSWKTFVKRFYGCFCRRRARTSFLMRRPGSRRRMFGWYTGEKNFTKCNPKDLIFSSQSHPWPSQRWLCCWTPDQRKRSRRAAHRGQGARQAGLQRRGHRGGRGRRGEGQPSLFRQGGGSRPITLS